MSQKLFPFVLLATLIMLCYLNALNNGFVSDDIPSIPQNPLIGNFWEFVIMRPPGFIRSFLYWLSFSIGGPHPFLFRFSNILFHIGATFLVYIIIRKLHNRTPAMIAAILFAVHPIIVESVTWISGGTYPQYTFFTLLSFWAYIKGAKSKKYLALSVLFFLFALMSHASALVFSSILFLYELVFGNLKKNWPKLIPFVLLSSFWLILSFFNAGQRAQVLQTAHYQETGTDNLFMLLPTAISSYFQLLAFPNELTLYHSELAFGTVEFIIRTIVFGLFILSLIYTFFKQRKYFFWLSLFFITLTPTLLPFRLTWVVAERYVYFGSIGIFAVVGLLLKQLTDKPKLKTIVLTILPIIILILMVRTMVRNVDWYNEDNLWIATGKTSPSSPNTHNNLGDVYGRLGDKQASIREFQTAIGIKPNYADAYHNLGNAYRDSGDPNKALENYHLALKYNPNLWQSYQNIAAIYFEQKDAQKALEYIQKGLAVDPQNLNLHLALAIIYLQTGQKDQAKTIFNQILAIQPNNVLARQGLAESLK